MPKKQVIIKVSFLILSLLFVAYCVAIVVLLAVNYDKMTPPSGTDFAIVYDAGSSSTKMYVYKWPAGLSAARGDKVKVTEVYNTISESKGLDKLMTRSDIVLYFNDMLRNASRFVPIERRNRTYVFLGATAGMRLLEESDPLRAAQIINYTRDYFAASDYLYTDPKQIQVISGKDEAVFGWITTNYLLDRYSKDTKPVSTSGSLDLGGASTQIVYVPSDTAPVNASLAKDFYGDLKIYGVKFYPYAYSFNCYGVNQIRAIYHTNLLIQQNYTNVLQSSCFPTGMSLSFTRGSVLASECTNGKLFNFPTKLSPQFINNQDLDEKFTVQGKSDAATCADEINFVFNKKTCDYGSCSFNNVFFPPLSANNQLHAFSNFFNQFRNTQQFFNIKLTKDLPMFRNKTDAICKLTLQQINDTLVANNLTNILEFVKTTCLMNHYILGLFESYNISTLSNVEIVNNIDNNLIGWSLGFLINQLNRDDFLPYEAPVRVLSRDIFIPGIIISSVFLLVAFVAFMVAIFVKC